MILMNFNKIDCLDNFFIAGLNYRNADERTRGRFAINFEQYDNILKLAPSYGIDNLMVLSTCNRTEIYGFSKNASQLIELLCSQTIGPGTSSLNWLMLKMDWMQSGIYIMLLQGSILKYWVIMKLPGN